MQLEPTDKPHLRPIEASRVPVNGCERICISDPYRLSTAELVVSEPAVLILSLMDGANTCEDIRSQFRALSGHDLSPETLQSMIGHLDEAHMLEGDRFERYYASLTAEFCGSAVRPMTHAAGHGLHDDSGSLYREMLDDVDVCELEGSVVGLIAPHLDYPRGQPCYAQAYATLRDRPVPDRIVILGTNHFGRSTSVVATGKAFSTPLGTTPADVGFLERLEARCGHLRRFEFDHAREHSVELQVGWLQYLFGAESFEMVACLCPDPCGPTGTAPFDGCGPDLREFARALGELIASDGRDTLVVAGADLSHIGGQFGDQRQLDDAFTEEVRRRDTAVLEEIKSNSAEQFLDSVTRDGNATRICSTGCIFALMTAIPEATATLLGYHQAVDTATQTCVTCAAAVFV